MKSLLIVANWKSNKTNAQAREWLQGMTEIASRLRAGSTVVLCAPYTALSVLQWAIGNQKLPIQLGAQNVSKFDSGAYTGEIAASQLRELVTWVIIGHSERRKYFIESDEDLATKVVKAKAANLHVIYCVPDGNTAIPSGVDVVAYEPVWAIGTGKTDTPENANSVCEQIKEKTGVQQVLYGGSVEEKNVASFISQPSIDGILVGGASLEVGSFIKLITSAGEQS